MVKDCMTRASEQKDAPLESPLGASEQKDASLESSTRVSEQKDTPLEHFFEAPEPKLLLLESPTVVSLHQRPPKWFPTAAPSGHWLLKWFPTAAPSGHWPQKCFPTAANEWKLPLSAGRVGAYCIRPQTIRTGNDSVWPQGAYKMVSNGSVFGSAAPMIFFRENCNKRRASASQWVETT